LTDKQSDLHKLAEALLEYETLDGKEINAVLAGEKIYRVGHSNAKPGKKTKPSATFPSTLKDSANDDAIA